MAISCTHVNLWARIMLYFLEYAWLVQYVILFRAEKLKSFRCNQQCFCIYKEYRKLTKFQSFHSLTILPNLLSILNVTKHSCSFYHTSHYQYDHIFHMYLKRTRDINKQLTQLDSKSKLYSNDKVTKTTFTNRNVSLQFVKLNY